MEIHGGDEIEEDDAQYTEATLLTLADEEMCQDLHDIARRDEQHRSEKSKDD